MTAKKKTAKKRTPVDELIDEIREDQNLPSKPPKNVAPEHDAIVFLRGPKDGDPSIWRSSNGFVDVSQHPDLTFPGSEVFVKARPNDRHVGFDIVGPVQRDEPADN